MFSSKAFDALNCAQRDLISFVLLKPLNTGSMLGIPQLLKLYRAIELQFPDSDQDVNDYGFIMPLSLRELQAESTQLW